MAILPHHGWEELTGTVLEERVRLARFLRLDRDAWFEGELTAGDGRIIPVDVRLTAEKGGGRVLERYLEAAFLAHPNLIRCFGAGELTAMGMPLVYAVLEPIEEMLSEVLTRRKLSIEETRRLGLDVIAGLEYLHERGLVYGKLDPGGVARSSGRWRLADYSQLRVAGHGYADETRRLLAHTPATPPEAYEGVVTVKWDAWGLACTLGDAVSGPAALRHDGGPQGSRRMRRSELPEPVASIVAGCLVADPERRCDLTKIASMLGGDADAIQTPHPAEVETAASVAPEREIEANASRFTAVAEGPRETVQEKPANGPAPKEWPALRPLEATLPRSAASDYYRPQASGKPRIPRQAAITGAIAAAVLIGGVVLFQARQTNSPAGTTQAAAHNPAGSGAGEADRASSREPAPPAPVKSFDKQAEEKRIRALLDLWVQAARTRNLETTLSCYAPVLEAYYNARNVRQQAVRRSKQDFFQKVGAIQKLEIQNMRIQFTAPDRAAVTLQKNFEFTGRTHSSGTVQQQLIVRKISGNWRIVGEREFKASRKS